MSLIADSGEGIQHRLDMVNTFMSHNHIKINCNKSSYHWARDTRADIACDGERLDEQGELGSFTYLGWTTNLALQWETQVERLVEVYQSIVCSTMAERGLLLDQKIRIINAIGNATIAYRTRLMFAHQNTWLSDLDLWMTKSLNKMGKLPPQTDKAYWYNFRGLKSLYCECTAGYIQHTTEKILNDPLHTLSVKAYSMRSMEKLNCKLQVKIASGMQDTVQANFKDTKIVKALHNADIRWMQQLLRNERPLTIRQFDALNMNAPSASLNDHTYDGWGLTVTKKMRRWYIHNLTQPHIPSLQSPTNSPTCTLMEVKKATQLHKQSL